MDMTGKEDALRLQEQVRAEAEAEAATRAQEGEAELRARYRAWAANPPDLARKRDLAMALCRAPDPLDKQLAVSYLRECWEVSEGVRE